jgi:cation diffusion facilitator CzcD-associated flavoprotein CzcO
VVIVGAGFGGIAAAIELRKHGFRLVANLLSAGRDHRLPAGCRSRLRVDRLVVPSTEVARCAWDEESLRWTVASGDGRTWEADAVVVATGQLHRPGYPRVEGLESFAGAQLPFGGVGPRLRPVR